MARSSRGLGDWLWEQPCRRRLDVSPSLVGKELSNI